MWNISMAITETHVVSGSISVNNSVSVLTSGQTINISQPIQAAVVSGIINVSNISGHSVTTSISGQTVNLGSAVSISGQPVTTSISGNNVGVYDVGLVSTLAAALSGLVVVATPPPVSDPVVIEGQVVITYLSGGTQLPNVPCRSGLQYTNINPVCNTYTGGLGDNAPYWKDNSSDEKGMTYPIPTYPNPNIECTNANQLSVVAAHTGIVTLTYMAFT